MLNENFGASQQGGLLPAIVVVGYVVFGYVCVEILAIILAVTHTE